VDRERSFGGVGVDGDGRVLVALADDAALALLDVERAPRAVQVVEGDEPVLHVGAHPHLRGGRDGDCDTAVAAGGEEPAFGVVRPVVVVDERDLVGRNAAVDEELAQSVVGGVVTPRLGCAQVAEHELQRPEARVRFGQ
jgi:hypothetical protein